MPHSQDQTSATGSPSYHSGIVIIGRLDGDAAARIAGLDGSIVATVEAHNG